MLVVSAPSHPPPAAGGCVGFCGPVSVATGAGGRTRPLRDWARVGQQSWSNVLPTSGLWWALVAVWVKSAPITGLRPKQLLEGGSAQHVAFVCGATVEVGGFGYP